VWTLWSGTGGILRGGMTTLLHRVPGNIPHYDKPLETDMSHLFSSAAALRSLAENYVGLAFKLRSGLLLI
jgi:hypothetical protein